MTGERCRRPAAVLAGDERNITMWKRDPRIRRFDTRVVPLADAASEDVEADIARELDLASHARDVVRDHDHAGRHRDHDCASGFRSLGVGQDLVAAGEVHGIRQETPHTLAAPHNVVRDGNVRTRSRVLLDPPLVERRRECGTGSL